MTANTACAAAIADAARFVADCIQLICRLPEKRRGPSTALQILAGTNALTCVPSCKHLLLNPLLWSWHVHLA